MKSWKQIRTDRRIIKDRIIYDPNNPHEFMFSGWLRLDGAPEISIVAGSNEHGWEHVSVCPIGRCPTWDEMCTVKDIFWNDEEECIQIHPKKSQYVNFAEHCLHIWRCKDGMNLPGVEHGTRKDD